MTAKFTTTITGLITAATQGTLTNVVTGVNWMVVAQDGVKFARINGSSTVGPADPAKFTDFAKLTQSEVIAWIGDPCTSSVQAELLAKISAQIIPAVTTKRPPWNFVQANAGSIPKKTL